MVAKTVPIIVAYLSPVRFVSDGKSDSWSSNVDDLNDLKYDYKSLCRSGSVLRQAPAEPVRPRLGYAGVLLLPRMSHFEPHERAARFVNRILGWVTIGGLYYWPLAPNEMATGLLYPSGFYRNTGGGGDHPLARLQGVTGGRGDAMTLVSPQVICHEEFDSALARGLAILSGSPSVSPELVLRGLAARISRDWTSAMADLWICIEQVISDEWSELVNSADTSIPGRKDLLSDSRTWTAAARIEVLFQSGRVDEASYSLLSVARKARNWLAHTGKDPDQVACDAAAQVLFRLLAARSHGEPGELALRLSAICEMDFWNRYSRPRTPPLVGDVVLGPLPSLPGEETYGREEEPPTLQEIVPTDEET